MIESDRTDTFTLTPARLFLWAKKGGFALLDQGLFSGANFLVNILLARWLPPEEYGAFAVALSVFYLLAGFHTAVLTEPMMVFGAGKYREQFRRYLGIVLYGHSGLSLLIFGGLAGAALVFRSLGSVPMSEALAGLAIASPFLLLLWLTRRACYVQAQPARAAVGSGLNLFLVLAGLYWLWRVGLLSAMFSLALLGAAALLAAATILAALRPRLGLEDSGVDVARSGVLTDHWAYGSWNTLAFAAYWSSGQILMLLIPVFLGLTASAAVAAVWNLYRPVSLFMASLGLVLLPTFSRWADRGMEPGVLRDRVTRLAVVFGGATALYGLVLTAAARPLLHFLYAGRYDDHWLLVGLFGLSTAASSMTGIFVLALKSRGRTPSVARIWALSAVLVGSFSIPLMLAVGVEGAIVAAALAYSAACWIAYSHLRAGSSSAAEEAE